MTKRNRNKIKHQEVNKEMELKQLLTIVGSIVLVFAFFAIITSFALNKETNTDSPAEIQYDNILVGTILTKPESKYYVLVIKGKDKEVVVYDAYAQIYKALKDKSRMYYVDLDDTFNRGFLGTKSNLNVTDISKIVFTGPTLLYIESGKIVKTYEGKSAVTAQLSKLID